MRIRSTHLSCSNYEIDVRGLIYVAVPESIQQDTLFKCIYPNDTLELNTGLKFEFTQMEVLICLGVEGYVGMLTEYAIIDGELVVYITNMKADAVEIDVGSFQVKFCVVKSVKIT